MASNNSSLSIFIFLSYIHLVGPHLAPQTAVDDSIHHHAQPRCICVASALAKERETNSIKKVVRSTKGKLVELHSSSNWYGQQFHQRVAPPLWHEFFSPQRVKFLMRRSFSFRKSHLLVIGDQSQRDKHCSNTTITKTQQWCDKTIHKLTWCLLRFTWRSSGASTAVDLASHYHDR